VVARRVSCDQEKQLVARIIELSECGFPIASTDIRRVVCNFAVANNVRHTFFSQTQMAGMVLIGFKERHPELVLRKPQCLFARRKELKKVGVSEYSDLIPTDLLT
jgi:hypothetical protein